MPGETSDIQALAKGLFQQLQQLKDHTQTLSESLVQVTTDLLSQKEQLRRMEEEHKEVQKRSEERFLAEVQNIRTAAVPSVDSPPKKAKLAYREFISGEVDLEISAQVRSYFSEGSVTSILPDLTAAIDAVVTKHYPQEFESKKHHAIICVHHSPFISQLLITCRPTLGSQKRDQTPEEEFPNF